MNQEEEDDGKVPDLCETLAMKRRFAAEIETHLANQESKREAEDAARNWIVKR
jgi:hypothetical protein